MIAVISPAKTLDFDTPLPEVTATEPRFGAEAGQLARSAARLPQKRLRELMHISPALARLNQQRYAFAGDVYHGLAAGTLDEATIAYAQDHLRILSGMYGVLRPLDAIRPHRLEMGTRWAPRHARLVDWWQNRIAATLVRDLEDEGSGVILNLASQEYWAAVAGQLPEHVRVVAVDFRDGADRRFVSFNAKRARGAMARWLLEHRVERPEDMQTFDWSGYRYIAEESGADRWRFVRG
jgi:hypothetical protein